ncbi:MAG: UvrD-helicase domain-containing protein [Flavobacteriia bacterium]|nr:UvrD-helicase domain-containing protein [Flavobacteriia bacterium]
MPSTSSKNFQVYSASAGAGKTFSLVKEYLVLCLKTDDPAVFTRILAITFTVKASTEMKKRVISALDAFRRSKVPAAQKGMFEAVREELGVDDSTLRNRANAVLKRMLHDYTGLSISTIDKFTYRVVRTFSHELGLGSHFEIDLDVEELYRQSVDLLLDETGVNPQVTSLLQRYIEDHMEDGKSWKPERKMVEMANHLGKEDSYEVLERLKKLTLDDFMEIRTKLKARKVELDKERHKLVLEGESAIGGMPQEFFSGKALPSQLKKLRKNKVKDWNPTSTFRSQVDKEQYYTAKPTAEARAAIDANFEVIHAWALAVVDWADNVLAESVMISKVLSNFDATAVLHEIGKKLDEYKEANNVETLSTFNKLIYKSLISLPVPYIYERIGEKYRHYFVDEFQDTSEMQWKNITPLVHNAIASGGTTMIVGDAKQSIYRWRGGKAEQFLNLINDAKNPEERGGDVAYALRHINLDSNWRSGSEIVTFNNRLFQFYSSVFTDERYADLYAESAQIARGFEGGYVNIDFPESPGRSNAEHIEATLELVRKRVKESLADGYRPGDIAILTRGKKHGSLIAEMLSAEGIEVVSSESLYLGNSAGARLIVACIRHFHYPEDVETKIEMVEMLFKSGLLEGGSDQLHHSLLIAANEIDTEWKSWLSEHDLDFGNSLSASSGLYELGETVARQLGLMNDGQPDPFVQFFLDELYEFAARKGQSIHDFLDWWEEKKEKKSITAPETMEAVQLLTIHKAKGLEFPVVIFPFANFDAAKERKGSRWVSFEGETMAGLPVAELPMSDSDYQIVGKRFPEYAEKYEEYVRQATFDNMNLLYVALTRPVERLYVVSQFEKTYENKRVSQYICNFVTNDGKTVSPDVPVSYGMKAEPRFKSAEEKESVEVDPTPISFERFQSAEWRSRVRLSRDTDGLSDVLSDQPRKWGNTVHAMMAKIRTSKDVSPVVSEFVAEGTLPQIHAEAIEKALTELVSNPELAPAFEADEVLAERDWLGDGAVVRPDRMARKGSTWYVIDYKTGEKKNSHEKQIRGYASLLQSDDVIPLLVYINDSIEIVKVGETPSAEPGVQLPLF